MSQPELHSQPMLAATACRRCREQKLKCNRELPSCTRCLRVGLSCAFPDPPDRKLLAATRINARKRKAEGTLHNDQEILESRASTKISSYSSTASTNTTTYLPSNASYSEKGSSTEHYDDLSRPLRLLLIETYFKHMYNAWLLFHEPTFLVDVDAGQVPPYVLLSIYATATIFLQSQSTTGPNAKLIESLGDVRARGLDWARHSGTEVLKNIDQPCLASVQACEVLALFWFAVGQSQRNTMFSVLGIAYRAARVLRLDHSKLIDVAFHEGADISDSSWLNDEIRRRCFWATWLTHCINSEHYTIGTSLNNRIMDLPLPINDESFRTCKHEPLTTTRIEHDKIEKKTLAHDRPEPSVMAELVKLMMIWAAIEDYLERRQYQSAKESLADLFNLDARLSAWTATLHPSLTYSKRNLYKQLVMDQEPSYIFIHALHHQCFLVLHSSLVPQFSGLSLDSLVPSEVVYVSARVALKHAKAISELGSDLITLDWDFSRVAPFVGYCIYVSASIYVVFLYSHNEGLATLAKSSLVVNLKVLKAMKGYWSILERMWTRINILCEAKICGHRPPALSQYMQTTDADVELPGVDAIDTLVRKQRDTGELEEPLATSVLEYSLRLRPNLNYQGQGRSIPEIERMMYNDPLARMADREISRLRKQQSLLHQASSSTSEQYPSVPYSQHNMASRRYGEVEAALTGGMNPDLTSLQDNSGDWWQVNFDNFTQSILDHNDLFLAQI